MIRYRTAARLLFYKELSGAGGFYFSKKAPVLCPCRIQRPSLNYSSAFQRSELRTMKLDTPQFQALFTPELRQLADLFSKHGYELRIAGGAVRDLLTGKQPHDVDFASTATPDQMKAMFEAEGVRMLNVKGERHGTVTARINNTTNFEVTTLRIDVVTDGRHAEVEFTKDWELDANRRDLTINSMFLGLDGTVYDYFNGAVDLENKRIAFVGDPAKRIREDYLRILRYFRFYGRVAVEPDNHESDTLLAIEENIAGLAGISGERIWVELKKILTGNHVDHLIPRMIQTGIAPYIGLPESPPIDEFRLVWNRAKNFSPHPITLLVSLLQHSEQMMNLHGRLKFSAYERDLGLFLVVHRGPKPHKIPLRPYQMLYLDTKGTQKHVHEWICEVFKYRGEGTLLEEFQTMQLPKFPVNGNMLKDKGVRGKSFNVILSKLKELWVESDFTLTADELLAHTDSIINKLVIK